jgi:hypothetical protein
VPLWDTPDGMPPGADVPLHPGDARMHHTAVLPHGQGRGDFTPEYADSTTETEISVPQQVLEHFLPVLGIEPADGPLGHRLQPGGRAGGIEAA